MTNVQYEIKEKTLLGEQGNPYTAFGITAATDALSVTVHDVTLCSATAQAYITRLQHEQIYPENLLDTIADYIDREK